MILIDFGSVVHRMIHSSVTMMKPRMENGKYITADFIGYVKLLILKELFDTDNKYSRKYGLITICIDNKKGGYWREDVYADYKANRKAIVSPINFFECFEEINKLIDIIKHHTPYKVIDVERAEGDDIMLVLAREYCNSEKVLILSPDKDMIQVHRFGQIDQYSHLTKKWLSFTDKAESLEDWLLEHICVGDVSDNVPRIVDNIYYTDEYMYEPSESVHKFKKIKFSLKILKKLISEHGSLDSFLDSHPGIRSNYMRNFQLVMLEGIPDYIKNSILETYKNQPTHYNVIEFESYISQHKMENLLKELPLSFIEKREISVNDFIW